MASGSEILLTQQQHSDLSSIAQSRALPAGYVFRAKLILMLAEGASFNTIKQRLQTTAPTIIRRKQRFRQYGLGGLDTYHPGQKPSVLTSALRARILCATRRKPSDGSTHWSSRKLAPEDALYCRVSFLTSKTPSVLAFLVGVFSASSAKLKPPAVQSDDGSLAGSERRLNGVVLSLQVA